jgi:hypothetical protein
MPKIPRFLMITIKNTILKIAQKSGVHFLLKIIPDFRITVGKFAASGPGTVVVNFDDELFEMPREIHDQVARALNVNPENGIIPCDSTQNITFTIGGLDLVLTPRDYVGRSPEGDCIFLGIPAGVDKFFNLPYTILRDRCLLLDYKNNQIGFANKK